MCKECGRNFSISYSEIEFYKNKGYDLPKRCKRCRDRNKALGCNVAELMRNDTGTLRDTKKWSVSVSASSIKHIAEEYVYEDDCIVNDDLA